MIPKLTSTIGGNIEVIQVVGSLTLTLFLVVLYSQQKQISKDQHELTKRQQEPTLEIEYIEIHGSGDSIEIVISNYGGGAATSMSLRFEFFELDGTGPIRTVGGKIRRSERRIEGFFQRSQSTSIKPKELEVTFGANSPTVLRSGGSGPRKSKSLTQILVEELRKRSLNVLYAKLLIEYTTIYGRSDEYTADFSIKFTDRDGFQHENMEFRPWADDNTEHRFTEIKGEEART